MSGVFRVLQKSTVTSVSPLVPARLKCTHNQNLSTLSALCNGAIQCYPLLTTIASKRTESISQANLLPYVGSSNPPPSHTIITFIYHLTLPSSLSSPSWATINQLKSTSTCNTAVCCLLGCVGRLSGVAEIHCDVRFSSCTSQIEVYQ